MDEEANNGDDENEPPGAPIVATKRSKQRPQLQRDDQYQQAVDFGILRVPEREGRRREQDRSDEGVRWCRAGVSRRQSSVAAR